MEIKVFKITSKKDIVYQELLEQYETNPELQSLLDEPVFPSEIIYSGDFRLITMIDQLIDKEYIKIYLVKDVSNDLFLWVIGKVLDYEYTTTYPLLKKQPKKLQLEIKRVLIENGLMIEGNKGQTIQEEVEL